MKEKDYIEIIKNDLHYDKTFCFRELEVYKNPVHGKETENISQAKIIGAIINEVERAERGENVNDIFVTAMTGFGKSIIYQTAAVCIAKKYCNLNISKL